MAIPNWQSEIIQLHEAFEAYFHGTIADLSRVEAVLAADFTFVGPDSNSTDRDGTLSGLTAGHGRNKSLKIRTVDHQLMLEEDGMLVAEYTEEHAVDGSTNTRRSTVIFSTDSDAPNGLAWRRVHETWINQSPTRE